MKLFQKKQKFSPIIKDYEKVADAILALEEKYRNMSDEELKSQTNYFKELISNGKTLDELVVPAYATVREAAYRAHDLLMYKVQVIGALLIHNGELAEMRTGEGKTLTIAAPLYLNSLTGLGVHAVTVNEYLVERDAMFMQDIMNYLDMSVGFNTANMDNNIKRDMYAKDITYTTNSELGFDYLRDNMVQSLHHKVQRGLNFCIIDEADSVLIDEARTPLIISGGQAASVETYNRADKIVKILKEHEDFEIDWEQLAISLTPSGVHKIEKTTGLKNLYNIENSDFFHRIQNALRSIFIFKKGKEYIVDDGKIKLVDHSTGRVMEGRSYSNGLHQAIQAKENLTIEPETLTIASITYQAFFRLYDKLSGTSGTLITSADEFLKIYNLRTLVVPTNEPVIRKDNQDLLYGYRKDKNNAIIELIKKVNGRGQPLLIGTASVGSSEAISDLLNRNGLKHELLNAKNHAREADIIASAGIHKAITIATNMAGRGTDIKPDEIALKAGGLFVIGTEKHESRRIDNQLKGRSGRQGQPGESQFFLCGEDELLSRFSNVESIKKGFGTPKGSQENRVSRFTARKIIKEAQITIEDKNFDTRKNLLEYDKIGSQQREIIYKQRDTILDPTSDIIYIVERMHLKIAEDMWDLNKTEDNYSSEWELILKKTKGKLLPLNIESLNQYSKFNKVDGTKKLAKLFTKSLLEKHQEVPKENLEQYIRKLMIQVLDRYWQNHLTGLEKLQESINLRSSESQNPISIFVREADKLFARMLQMVAHQVCIKLFNVQFRTQPSEEELQQFRDMMIAKMAAQKPPGEDKTVDGHEHKPIHSKKDIEDELAQVKIDDLKPENKK